MQDPPQEFWSWLRRLTFESVATDFPARSVLAALRLNVDYARGPRVDPRIGLNADLTLPGAGPRAMRFPVRIIWVPSYSGRGGGLSIRCTCFDSAPCVHVVAVLVDLGLSAGLREALLARKDASHLLPELTQLRAAALAPLVTDALVSRWASAPAQPVPLEYGFVVVREHDSRAPEPTPHIVVRARFAGSKAMVPPSDLTLLPLRARDQQIVSLLRPLSRSRRGFYATGVMASMLVQLLRDDVVLYDWSPSRRVRFSDKPLGLRIDRAKVSSVGIGAPHALGEDPGVDDDEDDAFYYDDDDFEDRILRLKSQPFGRPRKRAAAAPAPVPAPVDVDVLEAHWHSDDGTVDARAAVASFFPGMYPCVWVPSALTFFPVDPNTDQSVAGRVQSHPTMPLEGAEPTAVFRTLRSRLRGKSVKLPAAESMGLLPMPRPVFTVRVDGNPLAVSVSLEAAYPNGSVEKLNSLPNALPDDEARDFDLEAAAVARLHGAGLCNDPEGRFAVDGTDAVAFWETGIARLRAAGDPALDLVMAASLRNVRVRAPVRSRVRVSLVSGWLDTAVNFESENATADIAAMRKAVAGGRRWIVLDDGSLAKITEAVADLVSDVSNALPDDPHGALAPHQLGRIERWIETSDESHVDAAVGEFRSRLRALAVATEAPVPRGLHATLRPYQNRGLAWLQFLNELGAGGILADDMGLGKTLMTLALLLSCKERQGPMPSLVVCPTSVAGNWVREAARFTPDLRVLLLHGTGRHAQRGDIANSDVVITTYTLLRDDIELLAAVNFRYAILDEAQNVKNAEAATTRAARRLRTERRLALSGTPVENRLMELWSIMDFCNPGMLGSARDFEKRFERPIVMDPSGPAARSLQALVRPFVLRRTKREVLTDLPPKEEIDHACVLDVGQRQKYDALAAVLRTELEEKIRDRGVAGSGMSILTALLRLRQMACDPRLIDATLPASLSAKREAFLDRVRQLIAEGRRALVFSQFVELLSLWRADLDAESIAYEYLDGSTRDRDALVARFQQGTAPLFLISLRAGGTGLNLTAADTVIHCDPWWNPAVEDQATDRAHRIGQARAVTVYRLVARGTVEDSIMTLRTAKRGLADAVISGDAGALRGLTESDVRTLLGDVADEEPASATVTVTAAESPRVAAEAPRLAAGAPRAAAVRVDTGLISGDELDRIAGLARQWLTITGLHRLNLAQRTEISAGTITKLLNGRLDALPAQSAARIVDVTRDARG